MRERLSKIEDWLFLWQVLKAMVNEDGIRPTVPVRRYR
jgi:hypothetical protein